MRKLMGLMTLMELSRVMSSNKDLLSGDVFLPDEKNYLSEEQKRKRVARINNMKTFRFEEFSCEALNKKSAIRKYNNFLNNKNK